jgi:hypothetical protein
MSYSVTSGVGVLAAAQFNLFTLDSTSTRLSCALQSSEQKLPKLSFQVDTNQPWKSSLKHKIKITADHIEVVVRQARKGVKKISWLVII